MQLRIPRARNVSVGYTSVPEESTGTTSTIGIKDIPSEHTEEGVYDYESKEGLDNAEGWSTVTKKKKQKKRVTFTAVTIKY